MLHLLELFILNTLLCTSHMCPAFDHLELTFSNELVQGVLVAKLVTINPVTLAKACHEMTVFFEHIVGILEASCRDMPLIEHTTANDNVKATMQVFSDRRHSQI